MSGLTRSGLPSSRLTCAPAWIRHWRVSSRVFGATKPHHAYLFANRRANRLKVLIHDGFGIRLASRRPHQGKFVWLAVTDKAASLSRAQFDALVLGLPWQLSTAVNML